MIEFTTAHGPADRIPGQQTWRMAKPPNLVNPDGLSDTMGRLCACSYCGSMHPADVAAAIRAGATGNFADRKYGWPHKAYFNGVPNPHAGQLEICSSSSSPLDGYPVEHVRTRYDERTGEPRHEKWYSPEPTPARATTSGKFYMVHLKDASPEDRQTIEGHLGIRFEFDAAGGVRWFPLEPAQLAS